MKTLTIALCMLLVVLPVSAQQMAAPRASNFYVPYGVRDIRPEPSEEWSTSAVEFPPAEYERGPMAPFPQRYPVRRRGYLGYGAPRGSYPGPDLSTRTGVIAYAVVLGILAAALIRGDQ